MIHESVEEARGCGTRKPSKDGVGIYLVGPSEGAPCGRLPVALSACPTCGGGVHPSRSWTWIEPRKLFYRPALACQPQPIHCERCPLGLGLPDGQHGLLWIGSEYYHSPADFLTEARRMGISRKLAALPRGFELGETIVYLAHREAVTGPGYEPCQVCHGRGSMPLDETSWRRCQPCDGEGLTLVTVRRPGVFATFKPTGVDLVVDTNDEDAVPDRAKKILAELGAGARLVRVRQSTACV